MKREILQKLQSWKTSKNRKPLILKGVRQCGKTYILESFGQSDFKRFFIINFEQEKKLHSLFELDLSPQRIIEALAFHLGTEVNITTDLLIFDEIQACPNALTSLKYFSEKMPKLALCAAGSLLGLELTPASFPVGKVDFLTLYPMSFREFLISIEDQRSLDILDALNIDSGIPEIVHQHLWDRLKWYLVTGGLPEVVQLFVNEKKNLFTAFSKVREKQTALINAYYADIAKHAGKENTMHIERVFRSVPTQLARTQSSQAPRFKFSGIIPGVDRYQSLVGVIDWLQKAGLIIQTPIINHAEMPLGAFAKNSLFKLYCFDIGILGAMNQLPPKAILDYDFGTYKGYMAENFVAQHLRLNNDANFYCWQKDRSEVEFVQQFDDQVVPIEVKAGHIVRAKSLEKYCDLYNPKQTVVLSGNNFHISKEAGRYCCPLYFAQWLSSVI